MAAVTDVLMLRRPAAFVRQAACLARCNGAEVEVYGSSSGVDTFRAHVAAAAACDDRHMIVSYSRKEFKQTGVRPLLPEVGRGASSLYDVLRCMCVVEPYLQAACLVFCRFHSVQGLWAQLKPGSLSLPCTISCCGMVWAHPLKVWNGSQAPSTARPRL